MSDRTLLKEVLTEEKVETKTEKQAPEKEILSEKSLPEKSTQKEESINIFSSASFPVSQVEILKK